ncbi:MAG TPA: FKBP-type peptidyl-prolyl cis-trans isomerase, partial [Bacteroidia bacterium]|nr:FKBP-type peptidyl-prolyl cis-trans isomerase [Bacteroidia bacterium]
LEQGIMMMAKGDSAVFKVNADSLFTKTFHLPAEKLPKFINGSLIFTFKIKLVSFQTQEEITAMRQMEAQKRAEKVQARKGQENSEITAYLQKNNPTVKPDADSIFYLNTIKGTGQPVMVGDSLEIKYKGMFLDGKVFDQSDRGSGRGTFKVKYAKQMPLIKGWISVLGKMSGGDKVTVLIPSSMAYGAHGQGQIQPYTPLIFDIELVTITPNK